MEIRLIRICPYETESSVDTMGLHPAISADTITCNAGAASVPVFNPSSVSEAVGDYTWIVPAGRRCCRPIPSLR